MNKHGIFLDNFSNIHAVQLKKSLRHENGVLNALNVNAKVSTWDMSEHSWLPEIIESLKEKGLIIEKKSFYPWHEYKLTKEGLKQITI